MTLHADLSVQIGSFALNAGFDVEPGTTLALLGPNGAGKSTALRALAGLRPMSGGAITLNGRMLDEPGQDLFVPPERRSVGVVFQDYLLFGHLSAVDNVAFGLRARGQRKRDAQVEAAAWLDRVGLAPQARHKPRQLSGGQAQRVALARALAIRPDLLLLDEPLAALDAATRIQIRAQLRKHLDDYEGATVLVTHDPLDAMVLADRLLVVENGSVVQEGTPVEIARRPRTDYIAALVGLNLYRGVADGATVKLDEGGVITTAHATTGAVFVAFPPTAVSLHRTRSEGSPRNTWLAEVTGIEQHADTMRVRLTGTPDLLADVTTAAVAELLLSPGQQVWVSVKATETHTYPS
ncbi:molybdate transport system ATP-binding protein [Kibdelosporangium banguiense]|uniref:Molybdate transport system ATP-binding protein n=1 Tax=Kibdelosporangium banguiense TaxID=1365924 RepID=A0ABS4T8F7_9PSEU|nr:ABC transporter ATP-binding protein [Kibdelosporangium banguiense]MBP2320108.1 molybdate transport system ATP-binding protein [Kibdelosporangium banguiense]